MNLKFFTKSIITLLFFTILTLTACYNDNEEELYSTTPPTTCDLTTVVKFSTVVSPIIAPKCATSGCHNASSRAAGINLATYDAIKSYITTSKAVFLGSIKHESSFSNMPKGDAKLASCDIQKIESWITAGMLNN
jgi:hypothetical protein